jgi:hypothetical protein
MCTDVPSVPFTACDRRGRRRKKRTGGVECQMIELNWDYD